MMTELHTAENLIADGVRQGLHPGAQLYVSRNGQTLVDRAFGDAVLEQTPMRPDTLTLWMSACKPIIAIAVAAEWERGRLDLDAPVAKYIPDFAQGGKDRVTLRHVLTHTGGFPATRFAYPSDDWDTIIQKICQTPLAEDWEPGQKAGYHVHTGWFILGELVQRASGEDLSTYLRRHLFEPLGMNDSWVGMPVERYRDYAEAGRLSVMMNTSVNPPLPMGWHGERWVTHARPSGNGYGPARELGRFYEMLLHGGELGGKRVIEPETVELFTSRQREGLFDHSFDAVMDWGLGFIRDSKRYGQEVVPYGYGKHASDSTFGHSGYQSAVAFADPEHGLAVALVFNGCPGEEAHQERVHGVLTALYEDLGLV